MRCLGATYGMRNHPHLGFPCGFPVPTLMLLRFHGQAKQLVGPACRAGVDVVCVTAGGHRGCGCFPLPTSDLPKAPKQTLAALTMPETETVARIRPPGPGSKRKEEEERRRRKQRRVRGVRGIKHHQRRITFSKHRILHVERLAHASFTLVSMLV